jgi:PKD repeat protein
MTNALRFVPLSYAYTGTSVYIDPPKVEKWTNETHAGDTFKVTLWMANFTDLKGYEYKLAWDKSILNFVSVKDYIPYSSYYLGKNETNNNYNATSGRMWFVVTDTSGVTFNGSATLREITFKIMSEPPAGFGNYLYTLIDVYATIFGDSLANKIPHSVHDGQFFYANPGPVAEFTYSPTAPRVGETVTFNASSSYVVGGGTIVSYVWDFGDGSNDTGMITTNAYSPDGTYTVTLTVTDNQARVDTESKNVTVYPFNIPPIANFTSLPSVIKVNTSVTFNASASYDPDGTIANYTWDFGDGNITTLTTPIIAHNYTATGNYTVTLNVTDNGGLWNTFSQDITVWPTHIPPFARFTYSPSRPQPNSTVTFNATQSYDLDGTIVSYVWDFGDSSNDTGMVVTHNYTAVGVYTVTLNVTDNEGLFSVLSSNITVKILIPPIANFTYSPSMPSINYPTTFDASTSNDTDGTIVSYIWDFGDGNITTASTPTIIHSYTTIGNYTVTLMVIDNDDLNDTMTKQVRVYPAIAWLEIQPSKRLVLSEEFEVNINIKHLGEEWKLFGIQFRLNFNPTLLQFVNASEGPFLEMFNWSSSPSYTYLFKYPHTGYVTIAIGLLDGGPEPPGYVYPNGDGTVVKVRFRTTTNVEPFTSYPIDFTISNVIFGDVHALRIPNYDSFGANYYIRIDPPVPEFDYKPLSPVTGEIVTFNASASYDTSPFDNGTIVSYVWDFGDSSSGTGMIATHPYAEVGTYSVTLTVTDNDGNSRSITKTIDISRWYLNVDVEVGSVHFRGEIAQFYILTSVWGKPIDVGSITATLYHEDYQWDLSSLVKPVDVGLYGINYTISSTAPAGTWLLLVKANYLTLDGTAMTSFLISSTLTNWNAQLISISGDIATIKTDTGIIKANLTSINVRVISIQNSVATILTDVGIIKANLTSINSRITEVQNGVATIISDIGVITANLTSINARIVALQGSVATVATDVGTISVDVADLGTELQNKLPVDTGTISTVLYVAVIFSAIAAIILIYLILKKGKLS